LRNLYETVENAIDPDHISIMKSFIQSNITDNSDDKVEKILRGHIVFDNHMLNREKEQVNTNRNRKSL